MQAPEVLRVRVGAEVMLLINVNPLRGFYNGARGRVVEINERQKRIRIRMHETGRHWVAEPTAFTLERGSTLIARRTQFPLRLAWAVTMHKAQGQTLSGDVVFPLDNSVFDYGQAYVALSRVRSADQLVLTALRPECARAHPRAIAMERGEELDD